MPEVPLIALLGLGVWRVVEWVKEVAVLFPFRFLRFGQLLFAMGCAGALSSIYAPHRGWQGILVFFLGTAAVASLAHSAASALQAVKDANRMQTMARVRGAVPPRRQSR